MKVDNLTPSLAAAPGDRATCRLRIENTESSPVDYRLRVLGFDPSHVLQPPPKGPLAAGAVEEVALDFVIPDAYAAGHHSVAIEVVSDRPGSAPVIAAITVTVGSIGDVAMAVVPSTIRGRRRGRFRIDIDNRAPNAVELDLAGEGPDLTIRLRPDRVVLRPFERVRMSGKVKAPRHLVGEPRQHSLTVTARSRSAPSYAPATFHQRPLFPRGVRSLLAVVLVVSIWAAAVGAGFLWWTARQEDEPAAAALVDTDGDGVVDTPGDQMIDTDSDGVPDTMAAVVAEQIAAGADDPGAPQAGGSDVPTRTVMGGTVKAAEGGDPSGVSVTLIERDLGAPVPEEAAPLAFAGSAGEARGVKLWPARFGRYRPVGLSAARQTTPIQSAATGPDGAWLFTDVAVGQSHELSFALAGYDTQSFIVTPSADGKPVEVDVELEAARGAISGVVVGPGGPLGNVDLVLTDGILTFNTSTASGSGAGTFSITGVSTPGTYTLTANLRGYGTEVLQITLEPGEQRSGVRIVMRAGVGSISGRVTENGQPLGGVTLTASNGDVTRTTTSLTEGDRGLFTFPQLDIPGRYTVTASLEGYMTQTRLVTLNGNVTGVDFDFVKTTGGIIGLVESSNGGPLTGANIRVNRDELFFDTTTAVTPDPGSFTITELPPGTYLVQFSRFDHAPYSQTVTVAAGQIVDLGRIVLQFRERPDIPQNGSLEVRVVDSLTEPLTGARVRIFRVSDGALVAEQSDPAGVQSTFVFQPIEIGTYRVEVDKDVTYRPSIRRVSIGLSPRVEVIPLFRLGQVSGRLIDSFTADGIVQLRDYDVQILRINPDNSETVVQNIPVPSDAVADDGPTGDQIRWESAAASLTSGNYRVHVVNPPPGYRVVPDQVLVPGLPPMRFDIVPTSDTPIDLGDIQADRFPWVEGTVLAPQLGVGGAVTFVPIDVADLTVALTCPGTDGVANSVVLDAPRPVPPPGSGLVLSGLEDKGGGPALDSYFFDHVTLESNDLSGACTLEVNAAGFEPSVVPVAVEPGDGTTLPRIFRNVAMIRPENVGGTAYWVDDGVAPVLRREAIGAAVRTQGSVIVDFLSGTTQRTEPGSEPTPVLAPTALAQATGAGGGWAFVDPRQVFGSTNYVLGSPGRFAGRIIAIRLDQAGRVVTAADGSTLGLDATAPAIAVELDAVGGRITADVDIATIKGTAASPTPVDVSGFQVSLTGANTATPPLVRVPPHTGVVQSAEASFVTPDPGTHQVTVTSTATVDGRPRFDLVSSQPPTFLQQPGTPVTVGPVTFIERGAVDVRVNDVAGAPIAGATANLVNATSGATFPVTMPVAPPSPPPPNVVVGGLPVSATVGALTPYTISLDAVANPELDLSTASLQLFNENGALIRSCGPPLSSCGTFPIAQGGQPRAVIRVERFGSITGSVLGDTNGDGIGDVTAPLAPPPTGALTVTAQRIATAGSAFPFDCGVIPAEPERPVTAVGNSFRFSGEAGLYRIQVTHPLYEPVPISGPPQEAEDLCLNPDPALRGFVFRVVNNDDRTLTQPWTLRPLASAVNIQVRNDVLMTGPGGVGGPVGGATVAITRQGTSSTVTVTTDALGDVQVPLIPGAYDVTVTRVDASGPLYFPITFSLSIAPGGGAVTLRVPLPRIGGAITGSVIAVNSEDDRVPVPGGVQIGRAYDAPDPEVSGAVVGTAANPAPSGPIAATPAAPGSPPEAASTYQFTTVASGRHTLSFNDAGGAAYEPPGPIDVTVLGLVSQAAANAVYRAADRTVVVTVGVSEASASPDGALVRLVDPDAPAGGVPQAVGNCTGTGAARVCTTTFSAVPPELANYAVEVTKERYGTVTPSFAVTPGDPATPVAVSATIAGTVATVNGVAEAQNAPTGAQVPLPTTGLVELFRVGQATPIDSTPPAGNGSYTFDIEARGTYLIRASAPGYAPRSLQFVIDRTGGAGDLGSTITLGTVVVQRLATFAITVTPAAARTGAQVETLVTGTPTIAAAATPSATGFNVAVDPGASYRFTITSPGGFVPLTVPAAPQQPAVGATVPLTAAMQERTITGTVTGATTTPLSVRASNGTTTIVGTVTGSSYTISQVSNGTWTVEAAAYGSGLGSAAAGTVASTTGNITGVGVTLVARTVNIGFTTSPANVTIALAGGSGGTASGGALTLSRPENAAFPLTWTATADGYIPQTGTVARPAAPADPFAPGPFTATVDAITLVRPVVTATVLPPTGTTPVTDATVHLCSGATGPCAAATTGAIAMPFNATTNVYSGTPTSSGPWRIGATRGTEVAAPVSFTVSAEGVISPTPPITVTLAAP